MPSDIKNVAVHDLVGTGGTLQARIGRADLPVTPIMQKLIDDLHELYSRRGSKTHGRFSTDEDDYPTQQFLRDYIDGGEPFGPMTERMMKTLETQARRKPNAGGGHVFFAHFEGDRGEFLLIAILNDKLGAQLTAKLDVAEVKHLDMEGFRFAGRISISGWRADEHRYIGFLRGRGDVAEYFQEFLGCDATVQDKKDTRDLVEAIKTYADGKDMDLTRREAFLKRARDICSRSARERSVLNFESLANELVPEEPEGLMAVLADPDRGLSEGFVPNLRVLGGLVTFQARTQNWSLEFDRKALVQGEIEYDPDERSLTIKDVPPELVERLQAELHEDG